jgi:NADH-quinone oxidoreductase subunit M
MGMLPEATRQFALILAILAITSIVYGAFVAMMQTDLKRVIANSSVSHMGYVVLGASALSPLGFEGAVFQMFTHGTITGLLFVMVGLVYDRTHTRTISDLGGLAGRMPFIATTFVAAGLASLGLPGLSGFVSELLVFLGAFPVWGLGTVLAVGTLIVTAGYVLWLLERVFFGPGKEQWARVRDASALERATVSALLLVIILVGVLPGPLATVIIRGVAPIASRYLS